MRILHRALVDHPFGAAGRLLRRLKEQHDIVAQRAPVGRQPLGKCQQVGHVPIVPAGVHASRMLGGKGPACLLAHGQRIHIRAEGERPSRAVAHEDGADARLRKDAQTVRLKRAQMAHQILVRLLLFISKLGNPVQRAPVLTKPGKKALRLPID